MENEKAKSFELLQDHLKKLDEEHQKDQKFLRRSEYIMRWSFWIFAAVVFFTPFLQMWLMKGFCN